MFTTVAPGLTGDGTDAANGNGGNLTITLTGPGELFVRNGGQISAGTFGVGNAGSLTVNANLIEVTGSFASGGPSSLRSASERPWAGAGGTLDVITNRLLVADGGQIVTGTLSTNPASSGGNLTVRASEQIDLRGGDTSGQSGLFSSALIGPAAGGNITVETGNLFIRDGATISASNDPSNPASTLPSGTGPAGNVAIRAQNVTLDNGSTLNANTRTNVISDRNASITVNSQTLTLNNSRITTNAAGLVPGGNVTANLSTLTMLGNSAITADSVNSAGGRITINTAILAVAPGSRITARSGLGADFDGVVEINETEGDTPEVQSEEEAPEDSQALIASCEKLTDNELVLAGAGGLPSDPTYGLTSQSIWADTRAASEIDSVVVSAPAAPQPEDVPLTIVAAQGWATNDQGQIVLVAEPTVPSGETFVASHQSQYCGRG
ncbi:MAG: hypothetical protein HC812_08705 [Leptolyngbya sp. RL_3_1]|nr:hypothetical protein [Leptolyngbya sp. RL_3_1]